ncbi:MAG TPA: hypothetical protein VH186_06865 [Chloroflexia bacterium]|nr:hypothetical protein [Chloroflexia bacterium]
MEDKNNEKGYTSPEERRESGLPGGGQGRKDEVGQTHVYPVSGDEMPEGEVLIRTAGEFGQRGRGLEGYYDSGSSELSNLGEGDSDQGNQTSPGPDAEPRRGQSQ